MNRPKSSRPSLMRNLGENEEQTATKKASVVSDCSDDSCRAKEVLEKMKVRRQAFGKLVNKVALKRETTAYDGASLPNQKDRMHKDEQISSTHQSHNDKDCSSGDASSYTTSPPKTSQCTVKTTSFFTKEESVRIHNQLRRCLAGRRYILASVVSSSKRQQQVKPIAKPLHPNQKNAVASLAEVDVKKSSGEKSRTKTQDLQQGESSPSPLSLTVRTRSGLLVKAEMVDMQVSTPEAEPQDFDKQGSTRSWTDSTESTETKCSTDSDQSIEYPVKLALPTECAVNLVREPNSMFSIFDNGNDEKARQEVVDPIKRRSLMETLKLHVEHGHSSSQCYVFPIEVVRVGSSPDRNSDEDDTNEETYISDDSSFTSVSGDSQTSGWVSLNSFLGSEEEENNDEGIIISTALLSAIMYPVRTCGHPQAIRKFSTSVHSAVQFDAETLQNTKLLKPSFGNHEY